MKPGLPCIWLDQEIAIDRNLSGRMRDGWIKMVCRDENTFPVSVHLRPLDFRIAIRLNNIATQRRTARFVCHDREWSFTFFGTVAPAPISYGGGLFTERRIDIRADMPMIGQV